MRRLCEIAAEMEREIERGGRSIHAATPYAAPYLEAMRRLHVPSDLYGCEDAHGIGLRLLVNLGSWRGPAAVRLKAEMKAALSQ